MDKLKAAFEFVAPSTSTGFLIWGWLGAILANFLSAAVAATSGTWLLGFAVVFAIYVPLWVRAKRIREHNQKLQKVVDDIHKAMVASERVEREEAEEDVRASSPAE